ncbi:biopolymer transport protein ExbB [Pararhizobium capsulatum DSM 1112]|uniref:Biopolymer transport protein ExbB n=1 Tax=Pararhizobium capsulatum DSM 1112 TaxID=1121113 RepID=A0ABU0BRR1_9HYPH|nr:tonB-system energizer ExbB [Pararhizobium capsulatum]MDQ0320180.1 biopolymer transport protein ExbB [Pararhizobium capsulatum DSM 1112]
MPNRVKPTGALLAVSLLVFLTSQTLYAQEAAPARTTIEQPAPATQETVPASAENQPVINSTVQAAANEDSDATELSVAGADAESGANPVLPHDLSPLGMFMAADMVVKGVMGALALASVATWAILIVKTFELAAAKSRVKKAVRTLSDAIVLRDIQERKAIKGGPAGRMVAAATDELSKSEAVIDIVPQQGVKERVASQLGRIEAGAGKKIASGTGILATIGSISPFVGLFGTVWGIMNSFIGISQAQTTNLAIVAPGIAEALLATAIGLVAAIPAVVIYNYFSRSISAYRLMLADAAAGVERLVSRELDFRHARKIARKTEGHGSASEATIARIG